MDPPSPAKNVSNSLSAHSVFGSPNRSFFGMMAECLCQNCWVWTCPLFLFCSQHGDNRADIHTVASPSHTDAIRAVYGPGVARELISLSVSDDDPSRATFKMQGYISSANYTSKRTVMVLFINGNAMGSG
jgi:hypothetical protein